MLGDTYRFLSAASAGAQPVSEYLTLTYADLFHVQRVRNPFPLRSVSVSRVLTYLECPHCALGSPREQHSAEPGSFRQVSPSGLLSSQEPDPSLRDLLLHEMVDLLHTQHGPLEADQQARLLASPEALMRFLRHDFFNVLQTNSTFRLAMGFQEIRRREETFQSTLLTPMLSYQRELQRAKTTVVAPTEPFQLKLLATSNTFAHHQDWKGSVGLVGKFDQIRLRKTPHGNERLAIVAFQKNGRKEKQWKRAVKKTDTADSSQLLWGPNERQEPGLASALQLMMNWLAFQTRWDVAEQIPTKTEPVITLPMSLEQELDLILYQVSDARQYLLVPLPIREALLSVVQCLFFVNWAMKSGYARPSPEHRCWNTAPRNEALPPLIQVGTDLLSAEECYHLARQALWTFSQTVRWHRLPAEHVG